MRRFPLNRIRLTFYFGRRERHNQVFSDRFYLWDRCGEGVVAGLAGSRPMIVNGLCYHPPPGLAKNSARL